jgi:hypothetical protein
VADAVAAVAAALASRIVLPPSHAWMPGGIWRPSRADTADAMLLSPARRPKAPVAVVTALRERREAARARHDVETGNADSRNWNFDETVGFVCGRGPIGPDVFVLSARRPGRRKSEGILVGWRGVRTIPRRARDDVEYRLKLEFVYVTPAAAGQHQGAALVAAACRQMKDDLERLGAALDAAGARPRVAVVVEGDAYSDAGLAILDAVSAAAEEFGSRTFGSRGRCERDFGRHVVEP